MLLENITKINKSGQAASFQAVGLQSTTLQNKQKNY